MNKKLEVSEKCFVSYINPDNIVVLFSAEFLLFNRQYCFKIKYFNTIILKWFLV